MAQLTALTQAVIDMHKDQQIDHERLSKLETSVPPNDNHNAPKLDA